eukprot:9998958-Alexandrium_andersonii.AAC.1
MAEDVLLDLHLAEALLELRDQPGDHRQHARHELVVHVQADHRIDHSLSVKVEEDAGVVVRAPELEVTHKHQHNAQ